MYTISHSQISAKLVQAVLRYELYILQKLLTQFSQKYIFQNLHLISWFFRFYQAMCLVVFWNMLIWVSTIQFCGKFKINFSDIGNLFQERITCNSCKFFEKILFAEFLFNLIKTNSKVMSKPFSKKFQQLL